MRKEIYVVNYKCEKCNKCVEKGDTFCYSCGNNLKDANEYLELRKEQARDFMAQQRMTIN